MAAGSSERCAPGTELLLLEMKVLLLVRLVVRSHESSAGNSVTMPTTVLLIIS